ncbi:MAG: DUF2235 domain-containing protein [Ferruginibacter sp.]
MAGGKPNCCVQGTESEEDKEPKTETKQFKFYFDIFFDGTGNNAFNTNTRLAADTAMKKVFREEASSNYDKAFHAADTNTNKSLTNVAIWLAKHSSKLEKPDKDAIIEYGENTDFGTSSYENYYTNVYHLYNFFKEREIKKDDELATTLYVEGIGTASVEGKGAGDETLGGAFGAGETGIKGKAQKARKQVIDTITSKFPDPQKITIDIDFTVYGFSRGAAAARHFIHIIINGFNDLENFDYTLKLKTKLSKYNIQEINFNFVGLFDTVSAYNLQGTVQEKSNVQELGLNSLKLGEVKKVYHIAAKDEHRKNFALTTMGEGVNGKEITLPGVHSDIGGSYHDDVVEELVVYNVDKMYMSTQDKIDAENDMIRLIERGWFDKTDIYKDKSKKNFLAKDEPIRNALTFWNKIAVRRSKIGGISNKYARIPFTLMFKECGEDKFLKRKIDTDKDVTLNKELLKDNFIHRISESIIANPANLIFEDEDLKLLRKKYFHFSAHYNGEIAGMVAPYAPRFENKRRTRKIHPG